jgi:hypothetical protein
VYLTPGSCGRVPFLALLSVAARNAPALPRLSVCPTTGMLHAEGDACSYIDGLVRRATAARGGLAFPDEDGAAAFETLLTKSIEPSDPDIIRARSGRID